MSLHHSGCRNFCPICEDALPSFLRKQESSLEDAGQGLALSGFCSPGFPLTGE